MIIMNLSRIYNNKLMVSIQRRDGEYFQVIFHDEEYQQLKESDYHWLGAASEESRFMDAIGKQKGPGVDTRDMKLVSMGEGIAIVIIGEAQSPTITYADIDNLLNSGWSNFVATIDPKDPQRFVMQLEIDSVQGSH